jgi:fibronectin-binding autotransporter adhesin
MKTTPSNHTTKNLFKVGSFSSAVMIAITAFTIAGTAQTSANNYTWTGGVDGDWNDAGNWDIGIPGNYQHNLIFSGTSNTATNNDIGGSFGKITFSNTTAGQSFSLSGNQLNLYGTVSTAAVVGGGTIEDTISLNLRTTAGTRTFNLGTNHNLTVSGVITGPQGIIKTGDGKLTLAAANNHGGSTTINGGTLAIAAGGTTAEYIPIVINNTGTLRFDRNDTWGQATTDTSSSITVNAGGTMESGGYFNTIRDLNLNGGTVALTGGVNASYPAFALKGTVTVGGSQASQINRVSGNFSRISIGDNNLGATVFDVADATGDASADLTVNAIIQNLGPIGGNSLTKNGVGTMELTATNSYTGTTTVNGGTLRMVNSTAGNAIRGIGHNYVIASGATLEVERSSGGADAISNFNISGSGTFKTSGLEMEQTSASSNINMSSGALFHVESGRYNFGQNGLGDWSSNLSDMQVDNGATFNGAATPTVVNALNGAGTLLTGGGITVGVDNGSGSFSGIIGNSNWGATYSITKAGSGTQTLNGTVANTYSGGTTINGGTISLGTGGGVMTSHQDALGTGAVTANSGGELRLWISNTGSYTIDNAFTLDGGTVHGEDGLYDLTGAMTLAAGGGTLSGKWSTKGITVSGLISGSGALTIDEKTSSQSGLVVLTNNNTYTGGTTVDGGTLKLTGSGSIGNGGLTVNNGGTFSIANDDFNSLGGAITVNEGGTLSTDSTGGGNAHNIGAITLNGGTLSSSGNTWSEGNWILNGDVTVGGSALSTISGLAVGSKSGGGTYNVADSVAGAGTDLLVSAEIKLGSLTKTGTGTMELTGTGSYTGDTTVSEGTLSLASSYTHTGTGAFIVEGGTLNIADDVDITSSSMTISLGGVISPGNSPGTAITGRWWYLSLGDQ